jgi:hypothetical protein
MWRFWDAGAGLQAQSTSGDVEGWKQPSGAEPWLQAADGLGSEGAWCSWQEGDERGINKVGVEPCRGAEVAECGRDMG